MFSIGTVTSDIDVFSIGTVTSDIDVFSIGTVTSDIDVFSIGTVTSDIGVFSIGTVTSDIDVFRKQMKNNPLNKNQGWVSSRRSLFLPGHLEETRNKTGRKYD